MGVNAPCRRPATDLHLKLKILMDGCGTPKPNPSWSKETYRLSLALLKRHIKQSFFSLKLRSRRYLKL